MKIIPVEGYYSYVKRDGRINKKERSAGVVDTGGKPQQPH